MLFNKKLITVIFYSFIIIASSNCMETSNAFEIKDIVFCRDILLGKKDQTKVHKGFSYNNPVIREIFLKFNEDGNKLIIKQEDSDKEASYNDSIKVWDMLKEKELNIPPLPGTCQSIYCACFNKTGTKLARNNCKDVYVHNIYTGQEELHFKNKTTITSLCFNNQSALYFGDMNGHATCIDKQIVTMEDANHSEKGNDRIKDMCYNENSSDLSTVHYNDCVRIFNYKNDAISSFTIKSHNEEKREDLNYHKICSDTTGRYLLVINSDQQVYLIDKQNKTVSQYLILPTGYSLLGIYFDTSDQKFKLLLNDNANKVMHVYDKEQKHTSLSVMHDLIARSAVIDPLCKFLVITGECNDEVLVKLFKFVREKIVS